MFLKAGAGKKGHLFQLEKKKIAETCFTRCCLESNVAGVMFCGGGSVFSALVAVR